jgi:hypothetical protein
VIPVVEDGGVRARDRWIGVRAKITGPDVFGGGRVQSIAPEPSNPGVSFSARTRFGAITPVQALPWA